MSAHDVWTYAAPILVALFVWWFSTGAVLWIVGVSERTPHVTAAACLALLAVSAALLAATRGDTSPAGAYTAFTAAILLWGAQETAFLAGWVTGPWRAPCPRDVAGWQKAGYAFAAILYHELALLASMVGVLAVTWNADNRVGAWAFGVLFAMRISAKLNVFLGVPNITDGFLPARIAYLKTFFTRRPMNLLFPVSVTLSSGLLALLVVWAWLAEPSAATGHTLIATLVALALLEHWFLVLPIPVEALWRWAQRSAQPRDRSTFAANATIGPGYLRAVGGATSGASE